MPLAPGGSWRRDLSLDTTTPPPPKKQTDEDDFESIPDGGGKLVPGEYEVAVTYRPTSGRTKELSTNAVKFKVAGERPPATVKAVAPSVFEKGAPGWIDKSLKPVATEAGLEKEALALIRGGKFEEINKRPYKLLPFVINSLPTDDQELAMAAFKALHEFCEHKKLRTEKGDKNPVQLDWVASAQYRGSEFNYWAGEWWERNQYRMADSPRPPRIVRE